MREILLGNGNNPQPETQKHSETADWEYIEQSSFLYSVGGMVLDYSPYLPMVLNV